MKSGKVILSVLAGVTAGAILGVLFAPDKGSETRRKIIEKGEDYLDSVKSRFNEIFENLSGRHDNGEGEVADVTEKTTSRESRKNM